METKPSSSMWIPRLGAAWRSNCVSAVECHVASSTGLCLSEARSAPERPVVGAPGIPR